MNTLARLPAVFVFEWRRALTLPRMAWLVALTLFAPILLFSVRTAARSYPPIAGSAALVYVLCVCLTCMMSVFLWATPAISSELEGRSWVYLSVRPHGPLAVLLGKYLVAISWSLPVGLVSAIGSTLAIANEKIAQMLVVQCSLVCLSCMAYSAVFLLIGVIAPKRAMVLGVMYALAFEVGAAFIPAVVNLLTIQHRLRCIFVRGMEFDKSLAQSNPVFLTYFGEESAAWHIGVLLAMTVAYLVVAVLFLRFREFTSASETD